MNLNINNNIGGLADFVSSSINKELELGKNVLWFISGGSSIPVEVEIAKKIKINHDKLIVTLADERYGPVGHNGSNYFQLEKSGFNISQFNFIPFLSGKDIITTTNEVNKMIDNELKKADYKIGFFGIGSDGHTAGILPHSKALTENKLVCNYEAGLYNRITITPKTIYELDEAIIYAVGESKWNAIKKLNDNLQTEEEPAQILKKVPLLTIYTDYNKI